MHLPVSNWEIWTINLKQTVCLVCQSICLEFPLLRRSGTYLTFHQGTRGGGGGGGVLIRRSHTHE